MGQCDFNKNINKLIKNEERLERLAAVLFFLHFLEGRPLPLLFDGAPFI